MFVRNIRLFDILCCCIGVFRVPPKYGTEVISPWSFPRTAIAKDPDTTQAVILGKKAIWMDAMCCACVYNNRKPALHYAVAAAEIIPDAHSQ